jgi:hypothetical protein
VIIVAFCLNINHVIKETCKMELMWSILQVNEAAMAALEERLEFLENGESSMSSSSAIELPHFERALAKMQPSVSEQVRSS